MCIYIFISQLFHIQSQKIYVCVYYCRTYYKAVYGGRGTVKDMCYEVRRAEACVD